MASYPPLLNFFRSESLEPRLFAGGMVAMDDSGLVLNEPIDGFVDGLSDWSQDEDSLHSSDAADDFGLDGTAWLASNNSLPVAPMAASSVVQVRLTTLDDQSHELGDKAYFTILRPVPPPGYPDPGLTVNYTISGTAGNGTDYKTLSGSAYIPPAIGGFDIAVEPLDDLEKESTETVVMTIQAGSDYEPEPGHGTITTYIQDREATVSISASDATAAESGTPPTNKGTFRVNRANGGTTLALPVTYTVAGSATAGTDYEALSGTVTIPAGSSSATFDVKPVDDIEGEGSENVVVTLQVGSGYYLGTTTSATVNIADNEPVVTITAPDSSASEVGQATGQYRIARTGSTAQSLTVGYSMDGTAVAADYTLSSGGVNGSVTILAGQSSTLVTLTPRTDTNYAEGPETAVMYVAPDSNSPRRYSIGAAGSATITITDAPMPPNQPPTIDGGGSPSNSEGAWVSTSGTYSDPDPGDSVTVAVTSGPGSVTAESGIWFWRYYGADGPESDTVILTATDRLGLTDTVSFTYNVNNVAPSVTAQSTTPIIDGGVSYIEVGDAFTGTGSFTDPATADTWTGTVNWGDGSGFVPLSLSGQNFTLNHSYDQPNEYTITVRITDDNGGFGSATLNVTAVKVDAMTISETVKPQNTITVSAPPPGGLQYLYTWEDASGKSEITLDASAQPQTPEAARHVLWKIEAPSGAVTPKTTDHFGNPDPTLTLTPPVERTPTDGIYTVSVGFDNNGNGHLDSGEVDRQGQVYVLKVVDVQWVAINSPLDTNPHLNGGKRIFPDQISPTDWMARDTVDIVATVWPITPDAVTVHFRSFDVDDPNVDADLMLDPDDVINGMRLPRGMDNIGSAPNQRGAFATGTSQDISITTAANGQATAMFQVTKQPGDNFRIAAALDIEELDQLQTLSAEETGTLYVAADNEQLEDVHSIRLSEMLTVWRRLWIERDAMGTATQPVTASTINGQVAHVTTAPGPGLLSAYNYDTLMLTAATDLVGGVDAFEGGTITLNFGTYTKTLPIYNSSDNSISNDTVVCPTGILTPVEIASINGGTWVPAQIVDDDSVPVGAVHPVANGGELIESAFGEAYIDPIYVDAGPWNTRPTVPFISHVGDDFDYGTVSKDLIIFESPTFWTTTVVSAHENYFATDGDADGNGPQLAPPAQYDTKLDYGVSDEGFGVGNISFIFMETISDEAGATESVLLQAVVTHEIAHTAGDEIEHAEDRLGAQAKVGLLQEQPTRFSGETSFDNDAQRKLREVINW